MVKQDSSEVIKAAKLIEDIDAAVLRYYGDDCNIGSMRLGEKFLDYLQGAAVFQRIDEHGMRYEPPTCGTSHLTAERSLRIIESATKFGESISSDAIDGITGLVEQAGIHFARIAVGQRQIDDDVPF